MTPDEVTNWGDIVFAACWLPPPDLLPRCNNLKVVMSLGAGVDHLSKKASGHVVSSILPQGLGGISIQ